VFKRAGNFCDALARRIAKGQRSRDGLPGSPPVSLQNAHYRKWKAQTLGRVLAALYKRRNDDIRVGRRFERIGIQERLAAPNLKANVVRLRRMNTEKCYRFRTVLFLMGAFVLTAGRPARAANLITNGSFETPIITSPSQYLDIVTGSEPPGFGWKVTSGSVDVVIAGAYASTAFDGNQFLDLDGLVPGAIAQSFATTAGTTYVLSFAYANNPDGPGSDPPPGCTGNCATIPAHGTVAVFDAGTGTQLITPLVLTHGNSTIANPNWTPSGGITFVSKGTTTTLSFVSNDPSTSDGGIYLDAVSVETAYPSFFAGETSLGSGIYYLQFPDGSPFGYYNYPSTSIIYHYDMGFEGFIPGSASDIYLYDFTSNHWLYTSSMLFPYLYDFTLKTWIYYFPNPADSGHYTANPRYFSNLTTGQVFTM
jgi:hypothetical protein